jgi:hypothetical protein
MRALLLLGLFPPIWHQAKDHQVFRKLLRMVRPGTVVIMSEHERRHRERPVRTQRLANAGWLAYLAVMSVLILLLG